MTVKQLKEILDNTWISDNARVYLDCEIAEDVFLKKEVWEVKEEEDDYGKLLIICG